MFYIPQMPWHGEGNKQLERVNPQHACNSTDEYVTKYQLTLSTFAESPSSFHGIIAEFKRSDSNDKVEEPQGTEDPWDVQKDQKDYKKWRNNNTKEKIVFVVWTFTKLMLILGALYIFICSLSVMGTSFQILAGETAGEVFRHGFLQNPIAGLIIGVLVTVLVQSSSTSTSVVVTMTGAGILTVREAIPIIMGANIGTSVTNTIVSLFQSMKVEEFRRAFAGATVHDVFNLLSVLIFLPLEVVSHYVEEMTGAILRGFSIRNLEDSPDLLNASHPPAYSC
ncbi:unnamed protein product [Clavelina lepadiformis]|uniref:Uncharacterized protein n=1 Tax=Clavelina lepadiformis TaxID=159417 RepID=A0ABP0FXL6_CLALP